ncbi:response regulator [Niveibacterium sp. SC-1]|uniref:response regulator n=1 Tax=Niveibacterium sp. SC-1 TaxID=3135646 RepID=UPI00311EC23E
MDEAKARGFRPRPSFEGCRAVVADQHSSVRNWLREQLSTLGLTSVSLASSGVDLVRLLRNAPLPFDVVLCDHHLDPNRDGLQLLEELRYQRALPFHTIFILITAERHYPHVVAAAEFAPDDYLIKPFAPVLLEERLQDSMQRKRHLSPAHELLDAGEVDSALAACDKLIAGSSRYRLDVLRLKAELLVSLERVEEAAKIYEAVSSTRIVPWARMGLALTLQLQGRGGEAEAIALDLNEAHPEFISVYDFLARVREERGDLSGAAESLERAASITNSVDRLRRLADLAEAQGDHARASSALAKVLERTRKSSMLQVADYVKLVRSTLATGDVQEAKRLSRDIRTELRNDDSAETRVAFAVADALAAEHEDRSEDARVLVNQALEARATASDAVSDATTLELANACVVTQQVQAATELAEEVATRQKKTTGSRLATSLGSLFGKLQSALTASPDAAPVMELGPETELVIAPARASAPPRALEATPSSPAGTVPAGPAATAGAPSDESAEGVDVAQLLMATAAALQGLETSWSAESATECRRLLVCVFRAAPRERQVIDAHIRYNKLAAANGGERHKPGG